MGFVGRLNESFEQNKSMLMTARFRQGKLKVGRVLTPGPGIGLVCACPPPPSFCSSLSVALHHWLVPEWLGGTCLP